MFYASVIMGLSFLVLNLPLSNGLLVAAFSVMVITIAEMVGMPFMNSFYINRSSGNNRGQYAGLYTMSWSIAQVLGSSCGALLATYMGFFDLWLIVAAVCFIASAGYYWLQKKVDR